MNLNKIILGIVFLLYSVGSYSFYMSEPYDGGGRVINYYNAVLDGNKQHIFTAIRGTCASACTIKLGSNNLCIDPSATLLFHQASWEGTHNIAPEGVKLMMKLYPKPIKDWVKKTGALSRYEVTKLTGVEAIQMGVRPCP